MSGAILARPKQKIATDYQTAATALLDQMTCIEERMDLYQSEGERLKIETQVIKKRTERTLVQLQDQLSRLSAAA